MRKEIASDKRGLWIASIVFVFLAAGLLGLIGNDLRPRSLYDYQITPGYASCPVAAPIFVTVWVPEKKLVSGVRFSAVVPDSFPLIVTAVDQLTGRQLATKTFTESGLLELPFPEMGFETGVFGLQFQSKALNQQTAPCIALATQSPPNWQMRVRPAFPNFVYLAFEFVWPTKRLLWIWVLLPGAFWLAWIRPGTFPLFLLVLSLCCTVAGAILWQREYSKEYEHRDADSYGRCAQVISDDVTKPELKEDAGKWLKLNCRPLNSLGSALISILIMMGMQQETASLFFSALCGFGSLLIFIRILDDLNVSSRVRLVSMTLLALHWLHVRSFSRVISDEFGMFLVMLILYILMNRIKAVRRFDSVLISALLFALPLSRPPGAAFALFLLLGVMACDAWREKKLTLLRCLRTFLELAVIPLLLLAALFARFHWVGNYLESVKGIKALSLTLPKGMVLPALIGVFQWLPLVWICGKNSIWKNRAVVILVAWLGFYSIVLMVVNSGLPARFLVPVLPVVAGLSAIALEECRKRWQTIAWGLVWIAIVANAGALFYQIFSLEMNESIIPFITSW